MSDLEQFCILAKTQKSRACATLIQQVIGHRKIFVFGELLALHSVATLKDSEFATAYNTLELFAYGNYQDFVANTSNYLELSEPQLLKLKQLSLVALAVKDKVVSYNHMGHAIGINISCSSSTSGSTAEAEAASHDAVRALEDILISAMYAGLISGKLDQQQRILRVKSVMARDVKIDQIPDIIKTLSIWRGGFDRLIESLQQSSSDMQARRERLNSEQETTQLIAESKMQEIKDNLESGGDMLMDTEDNYAPAQDYQQQPQQQGRRALSHANTNRYGTSKQPRHQQQMGSGPGGGGRYGAY